MSLRASAYIAGAWEHPTREAPDKSLPQLHAEMAAGALADAGLSFADIDGYFCAGDAPGMGGVGMAEYLGLKLRYTDSTETGGSSYVVHAGHAAAAIAAGKCTGAPVTMAGTPRSMGIQRNRRPPSGGGGEGAEAGFEFIYGPVTANM